MRDDKLRQFYYRGQVQKQVRLLGNDNGLGQLVAAVNTALILGRPLLVTGRPGTGKTELAERIAYELGLGAVLRFE